MILDTHDTLIYLPMPLLPAPAFIAAGLTRNLDDFWGHLIPFLFWNEIFGFVGVSLLTAAFYRYACVKDQAEEWFTTKNWIIIAFIHIFAGLPSVGWIVVIRNYWNLEEFMEYYKENWPDIYPLFLTHRCMGISTSNQIHLIYVYIVLLSFALAITIGVTLTILTARELRKIRDQLSAQTYKLQKELLIAIIVQSTIPTIIFASPYIGMIFIVLFDVELQFVHDINGIFLEISTLHSLSNTIIMCALITCYRKAIIKIVKISWMQVMKTLKIKSNNSSTTQVSPITAIQSSQMIFKP